MDDQGIQDAAKFQAALAHAQAQKKPVVLMKVCLGSQMYEEQFSLNDRDKMNYPVLIGRRTLEKVGLVDSSKTFTIEPSCSEPEQ